MRSELVAVVVMVMFMGCGPYPTKAGDPCGTYGLNTNVPCPAGLTCLDKCDTPGHESCYQVCGKRCTLNTTECGTCTCGTETNFQVNVCMDATGHWCG